MLAAKCQSARFQHNSEWSHRIAIAEPHEALDAVHDLLTVQDKALAEAQVEAARRAAKSCSDRSVCHEVYRGETLY
jgi:hypothetical protein